MKKIVCLIAALLGSILLLSSCTHTIGTTAPSTGGSVSGGSPADFGEPAVEDVLSIIENETTEFTIVYEPSEYWDKGLKLYVDSLQSEIRKKYHVEMETVSTGVNIYHPQYYEILIGDTGYEESRICRRNLREGEWSVSVCGNKLVLLGTDVETTKRAVYWFTGTYLKSADVEKLTFSESDAFRSQVRFDVESISVTGTELKDFRIVVPEKYSAAEYEIAGELRKALVTKYGYSLEVVTDEKSYEHELRIGISGINDLSETEFHIQIDGGNIEFSAPSVAVYDYAVQTLVNLLCADKNVVLEACDMRLNIAEQLFTDGVLKDRDSIRVIYHNVYGWTSDEPNIGVRAEIEALLYDAYAADVLCLQEMSAGMRKYLVPKLNALGFVEVSVNSGGMNNYTPVFYRTDRIELVDSGWLLYDGLNDVNSKSVTWAQLREKATGKEWIVCSTHFCYNDDATRVSNANQLISLLNELSGKKLPMVFGGDLNTILASTPLQILLNAGYSHAWNTAENKNDLKSIHAYPVYDKTFKYFASYDIPNESYIYSIDHAFYQGAVSILQFRVLNSSYALKTSDHCPLIVDISFR